MSDRLTSSSERKAPWWSLLYPLLFLALASTYFLAFKGIPAEFPSQVQLFPDALQRLLASIQFPLLILSTGLLLPRLLIPSSGIPAKTLAICVGSVTPLIFLMDSPDWVLAEALILGAACLSLIPGTRLALPRAALAGACAGLALSVDFLIAALLPGLFVLEALRLKGDSKRAWLPFLFWLLCFLLPQYGLLSSKAFGGEPSQVESAFSFAQLWPELPYWTLPFLPLGLLVALAQKRPAAFLLLSALVLSPALIVFLGEVPLVYALCLLLFSAYGIVRLMRGVEQGLRRAAPKAANLFVPVLLGLTFAALTANLIRSLI